MIWVKFICLLKIWGNIVNGLKEMWIESFFKNTFRDRRGNQGRVREKEIWERHRELAK